MFTIAIHKAGGCRNPKHFRISPANIGKEKV